MMFSNAEAYDRFMGRWSRVVAPLLVDFAGVPAAGRILDVGSGIGTLAFEIAKRNAAQVTGIDPSREFVAYSRKMNPFPDRASFYVADVHGLPFKDAAFAAGYSLLVFNFLADAKKSSQEVRRVTQPAGGITAAVWDYGDVMGMLRTFWNAAADVDARKPRRKAHAIMSSR